MIQAKPRAKKGDPVVITNAEFAHLLVVLYLHESWRSVPQFPGYEISSHGRIKGVSGKILKPDLAGHKGRERSRVTLYRCRKEHRKNPHRLVLEAFVGPCPEGMEACHWDDNCFHNHLWNLRWDTRVANTADRARNGKVYKGSQNGRAKATEAEVVEIRRLREEGHTCVSLSSRFGLSETGIRLIVSRESWKHV